MKQILALSALLLLILSSNSFAAPLASQAIAGEGLSIYGGQDATVAGSATAVMIGKSSNGVRFSANYSTTQYSVACKHDNGTKTFGTSFDSTAIYTTEVGTGAMAAGPSAPTNAAFATWTEM